jgi:hypothetical protein
MKVEIPPNDPNFMDINNLPPGGMHLYLLPDGLNFVLTKDKTFDTTIGNVTIQAGFVSDGPSIPPRLRSIINSLGKHFFAAFLHDLWYRVIWARIVGQVTVTKQMADDIFLKEMKDLKVPWWRRRLMWRAVQVGGGSSWREDKES